MSGFHGSVKVDLDLHIDVEQLNARQRLAALRGLRRAAEEVRTRAMQITPKDKGPLRASAEVVVDEPNMTAYVSYNTPYAVYQHENLELNHTVGEAKFLEKTIHENAELVQQMVAKAIRDALS